MANFVRIAEGCPGDPDRGGLGYKSNLCKESSGCRRRLWSERGL